MKNIKPKDLDVILSGAVIGNSYDENFSWEELLRGREDKIIEKMAEIYEDMEGQNDTYHEALGIKRDGSLYKWSYVGTYSEPESVWNGNDLCIERFNSWYWDDVVNDWDAEIRGNANTPDEAEKIIDEIKEVDGVVSYLEKHYPAIYKKIKRNAITEEVNQYTEQLYYNYIDQKVRSL